MPGKVKVKIISGRNLPVMDRSSDTTDAYVEIKLGSTTYKTDVCRKSLHPQWNSDWYRFELDDAELQDEPLQIRLMDHDTYSANDAIGKVYLDLNPLLLPSAGQVFRYGLSRDGASNHDSPSNSVMSGWIPVYDTMHGIRGEVNILVKVELFSDFNRFRQSSCGVQFFCSPSVPQGYYAPIVHGFVEELVVNDDPEYQWIDKIRTPRASNEARQTLFFKLSRELQRKIGVKALDLGGNAVVGYRQCFDLEGESGIVARGIGTAVTLVKIMDMLHSVVPETNEECAQNYLKFLGSHASFSLATELKDPVLNQYIKKYNAPRFTTLYPPSPSSKRRHSPHMDEIRSNYSLKSLLEQEERRGTPGSGISQRIKNLKHSSHNMLSKKMTALKAKLGDGIEETSEMNPDNLKRRSPFPFKRTVSESNVMATVLARSVIQAHNSLGSILEKQHSPSLEIGVVEKPLEGVAESDTEQHLTAKGSLSDPFLFTDVESKDDQLSIDSELSESSSSGDDDEDEDSVGKGSDSELDTLSIIVKNVEIIERRKLTRQFSLPIYAHEESYCEDVSRGSNEISLMSSTSYNNANASQATSEALEKEGDNENENDVPNECDTKEKPSSKASSKSPKLKREKCFNLESCTNDDEDVENEISLESANTDDSLEKTKILHELQLPVPHLSEKKTIIPPIMLGANIPKKSLMKTAMATMLLEKVNIIGTYTPPVSPVSKSQEFKLNLSGPSSQYSSQVPSVTSSRSSMFSKRNSIAHDQQLNYLLSRSLTTSSLSKMNHKRDTVLGVPFMSLSNIRRQISHPCFQTGIFETEEVHANIASQQRSPTCFSDSELHRPVQRDNTKETPFERFPVGNITRQYRNRSPCFSDTILHKRVDNLPNREYVASQDNINKNKDTFLSLLQKDTEADPLSLSKTEIATCSKSPELPSKLDKKRGLSFYKKLGSFMKKLHKTSNLKDKSTSVSDLKQSKFSVWSKMSLDNITLKNTRSKSTSVVSPIFQKHTKVKSSTAENNFKKHGLVGTALGNVVMETVQDILATSHPDKNKSEVKHESGDAKSMVVAKCDVSSTSLTSAQVSPVPSLFSAPSHGIATPVPTTPNLTTTNTTDKCNESNAAKYSTNDASVNMKIDNDASLNNENNKLHASLTPSARNNSSPQPDQHQESGHHRVESVGTKILASPAKLNSVPCIHRRSSDSDLSITPKGNSLTGSDRSCGGSTGHFVRNNVMLRSTVPQENFEMLEYPFLTMSKYPPGFIVQLGGAVFARSVKLLERITNLEEPESRDTWWSELRMEIRSHARALNCNAVLGYTETTSICEDVCVLSASGTAAVIGFHYTGELGDSVAGLPSFVPKHHGSKDKDMMTTSADRTEFDKDKPVTKESKENANVPAKGTSTTSPEHDQEPATKKSCAICHLPYNTNNIRVTAVASKCAVCKAAKVPEVLITTIEMPDGIQTVGRGCFIQSAACRSLRDAKSESNAKEISDGLPFLEYELHRLLVNKLRIKAMNSIFGLKITISVGEKMLIGVATGTASFIAALPAPFIPQLVSDRLTGQRRLAELQKELTEVVRRNIEVYQLKEVEESTLREQITSDNDDSEEDQSALELSVGNKDCCLLEIDDPEDVELVQLLIEGIPPDGFHVVNTEFVPGLEELEIVKNLQMFTQIYRAKLPPPYNLNEHFYRCLQTLFFKLRRMVPCALCDVQFRVDIPEVEELQITVVGMALGLGDPQKNKGKRKNPLTKRNEEDMIFNLDEDQVLESNPNQNYLHSQSAKFKPKSPMKLRSLHVRHIPYRERHGVDITPLSYVPGGKIERYLGNLNFFFIRETTSIREEGGLSGFIHSFATEVLAIVRAHVTALGGNAMVAYFMTECIINHSLHKNQRSARCIIEKRLREGLGATPCI